MGNDIVRTGGNGRRSKCVAYGGLVYVSGTTTVDIKAGIREQARDVFDQIEKLLAANGSSAQQILTADITLRSMDDYGDFNAVWDEWVTDGHEPARSVIEGKLALPEYKVKVAVIAAQQ